MGALHGRNGLYTEQTVYSLTLHLNLPITHNFLHFTFKKKNFFPRGDLNLGPHVSL